MVPLCIFDLDGTLIKCQKACLSAWEVAIKETCDWSFPKNHNFAGNTDYGIIQLLAELNDVPVNRIDELVCNVRESYLKLLPLFLREDDIRIIPGGFNFLKGLKENGYLIAIATGNFDLSTAIKLKRSGLAGYFDVVATADDAPTRYDIVRHALSSLHIIAKKQMVEPTITYLFGDTMNDLTVAKQLRLPFILVSSSNINHDEAIATIRTFTDPVLFEYFPFISPEILETGHNETDSEMQ